VNLPPKDPREHAAPTRRRPAPNLRLRAPLVLQPPGLELDHLWVHDSSSSVYLHLQILNVQ